jgi:predicted dehydrogenase
MPTVPHQPTPLPIVDRPIRLGVVGLGQISELVLPTYAVHDGIDVVALCDRDPERLSRWAPVFPSATTTTELGTLCTVDADVVDVLVPTPAHAEVATAVLDAGYHVQLQKPLARDLDGADRILAAAARAGAQLRVMEDYVFYPPLVHLRDLVARGDIGDPAGLHMKIVATGRGGWEVPASSYRWQFEQARDGRGMLVFDHGWHQLAVADWLFGPVTRVFGWIGATEVAPEAAPGLTIDAPATLVWEHDGGVRGVLDITFAPDTYFRSDYYTGDERIEVTGTRGSARLTRISAKGVQEPAVTVYRDGTTWSYHDLDDSLADGFAASTAHALEWLRGRSDPVIDATTARRVLRTLLAALDSSARGAPVDVVA